MTARPILSRRGGWGVPLALVALGAPPLVAGALRLVTLAGVAELMPDSARAAAAPLRTDVERLPEAVAELRERARQAAKGTGAGNGVAATIDADALAAAATRIDGADVVAEIVSGAGGAKQLMDVADRIKGRLGEQSATVLGAAVDDRVHLVAAVTPALVARGVKAGAVVKAAAAVAGGGGGGRDTMAQAGGRDPDKLPEAIAAARAAIRAALTGH